ncbi:hypothetical protein DNTS_021660 [Danionella cerebrum]|uniref:L27 domain-containing protein n=1 Tax=Danionella cerebrum TaxID=2873325 RepID=A0A553QLZ9_9TELE|nr:hypothetical protein DNTS_021660 [Danionella translucida]
MCFPQQDAWPRVFDNLTIISHDPCYVGFSVRSLRAYSPSEQYHAALGGDNFTYTIKPDEVETFLLMFPSVAIPRGLRGVIMPLRKRDTARAISLLEEYCCRLKKPEEQQLKTAILRVMDIFKSSLFQALIDIQEFYEVTLVNSQKSCEQKLVEVNHMAEQWEYTATNCTSPEEAPQPALAQPECNVRELWPPISIQAIEAESSEVLCLCRPIEDGAVPMREFYFSAFASSRGGGMLCDLSSSRGSSRSLSHAAEQRRALTSARLEEYGKTMSMRREDSRLFQR